MERLIISLRNDRLFFVAIILALTTVLGLIAFVNSTTDDDIKLIETAEARSTIMFSANLMFYDKEDRRNMIENEERWNCGGTRYDSNNLFECLRIQQNDVITLSWWQMIDGKYKGMHYPCNNGMVCLNYDNTTAFLFVEIEDPSIVFDIDETLKMNERIIDIQPYRDWNDPNFQIVTVEIDDLNDFDGNILPSITLFFPTDFENICLFAIDYITCEMNQALLKELQKDE